MKMMDNRISEYDVEVDGVDEQQWETLLKDFSDATIYQTWSYGAVRWGSENLSHLTLKCGDEVVGQPLGRCDLAGCAEGTGTQQHAQEQVHAQPYVRVHGSSSPCCTKSRIMLHSSWLPEIGAIPSGSGNSRALPVRRSMPHMA